MRRAAEDPRIVLRVSMQSVRYALLFRFLWDAMFYGFDMASAVGAAVARVREAAGVGAGDGKVGAREPGGAWEGSEGGGVASSAGSEAGRATQRGRGAMIEVSVTDGWVDLPRNSVSGQALVARFDRATLTLPACPDALICLRQTLRAAAVGGYWGPNDASLQEAWLGGTKMHGRFEAPLTHPARGRTARFAPSSRSQFLASVLERLVDTSGAFLGTFRGSPTALPQPEGSPRSSLAIRVTGARVFQTMCDVNPVSRFDPKPHPATSPFAHAPSARSSPTPGLALARDPSRVLTRAGPPAMGLHAHASATPSTRNLATVPESAVPETDLFEDAVSGGSDDDSPVRPSGRGTTSHAHSPPGYFDPCRAPHTAPPPHAGPGRGYLPPRSGPFAAPGLFWRHIGGGSEILLSLDLGPSRDFLAWRFQAFWPSASLVFGEAQYDLLMGFCMENLFEEATFSDEALGYLPTQPGYLYGRRVGSPWPPAPDAPSQLGLQEAALFKRWEVAVDVPRIEVLVETPAEKEPVGDGHLYGSGKAPLAILRVADLRVGVHTYLPDNARRVRVGAGGLALHDVRWGPAGPSDPALLVPPPPRFATNAARLWERCLALSRGHAPSIARSARDDATTTVAPDCRFLLDLTMQRQGTAPGPMVLEIATHGAAIFWPYLTDLQLIWDIVECTTAFWFQPFVSPFAPRPGPDPWIYVNVVMAQCSIAVPLPPAPSLRTRADPPPHATAHLLLSTDALRVLYAAGGDGEAKLRIDLQRLAGTARDLPGQSASQASSASLGPILRPVRGFVEVDWRRPKDKRMHTSTALTAAFSEIALSPAFAYLEPLAALATSLSAELRASAGADEGARDAVSGGRRAEAGDRGSDILGLSSDEGLAHAMGPTPSSRVDTPADRSFPAATPASSAQTARETPRAASDVSARGLGPEASWGAPRMAVVRGGPSALTARASGAEGDSGTDWDDDGRVGESGASPGGALWGAETSSVHAGGGVARAVRRRESRRRLEDAALQMVDAARQQRELQAQVQARFRPSALSVSALLEGVVVTLVDDRYGHPIESLRVSLREASGYASLERPQEGAPPDVHWHVAASIDVRFLNSAIDQMEHLIEPWSVEAESRAMLGNTHVLVNSDRALRAVASPACLRSLGDALAFARAAQAAMQRFAGCGAIAQDDAGGSRRGLAPATSTPGSVSRGSMRIRPPAPAPAWAPLAGQVLYRVRNRTGGRISVWANTHSHSHGNTHTHGHAHSHYGHGHMQGASPARPGPSAFVDIPDGAEVPLRLEPAPRLVRMAESQLDVLARTVTVQLEGNMPPLEDVIVDKVGTFAYELRAPHGLEDASVPVIVEVGLENRTRTVTLRSTLTLRNDTALGLSFRVYLAAADRGGSRVVDLPRPGEWLPPGGECHIPVAPMRSCRVLVGAEGRERAEKDVINIDPRQEDVSDQQGLIACPPRPGDTSTVILSLQASTTILTTLSPTSALKRVPCHRLSLRPVVRITNLMPGAARLSLLDPKSGASEAWELRPGETVDSYAFDLHHKLMLSMAYGHLRLDRALAHQPLSDVLDKDLLSLMEDARRQRRREVARVTPLELTRAGAGAGAGAGAVWLALHQRSSLSAHWKEMSVLAAHWLVNESGFDLRWRDKPTVPTVATTSGAWDHTGAAKRRRPAEPPVPIGSLRGIVQLSLMWGTQWSRGINLNQVGTKSLVSVVSSQPLRWEGEVREQEAKERDRVRRAPGARPGSGGQSRDFGAENPAGIEDATDKGWVVYNAWSWEAEALAQAAARDSGARRGIPRWYLSQGDLPEWRDAKGRVVHKLVGLMKSREQREARPRLDLAVDISLAPGPFSETRVLTLTPRYTLHNRCGHDVEVTQRGLRMRGRPVVCRVPAGASLPFHWPDAAGKKELCVRLTEGDSLFSGSFRIDRAEDVALRLPTKGGSDAVILHVVMRQDRAALSATFFTDKPPPYRIENRCREARAMFRQAVKGARASDPWRALEGVRKRGGVAHEDYAWDEPLDVRRLAVRVERERFQEMGAALHEYPLDDIKAHPAIVLERRREGPEGAGAWGAVREAAVARLPLELRGMRRAGNLTSIEQVYVAVYADGPTRVLAFSDSRDILMQLRNEEQELAFQVGDESWGGAVLGGGWLGVRVYG